MTVPRRHLPPLNSFISLALPISLMSMCSSEMSDFALLTSF